MKNVGLFIPDAAPVPAPSYNGFETMTVAELKDYAATYGIDIGKAKNKAEIIDILSR